MKHAFVKAFALCAVIGVSGCSQHDDVPIDIRDPLSGEQKRDLDEMQATLDCYTGYRGTNSISDDLTITRAYGADQKPSHVDQDKWDYWNAQREKVTGVTRFTFNRSSISPREPERDIIDNFVKQAEDQSAVFYVVGTADGSFSKKSMSGDKDAPSYVNEQITLLRVNAIMEHMIIAGINPRRVCRAPKGMVGTAGVPNPNNRGVTVYSSDSGLDDKTPAPQ
jgi:hypothetical protein